MCFEPSFVAATNKIAFIQNRNFVETQLLRRYQNKTKNINMNCYKTKYKVTTRIQDDQYDLISKYLFIKINVFYEMSQYILYISSFSKIKNNLAFENRRFRL